MIPEDLRELYEAAKGVQGTGLPIPWAADRAVELIERIAKSGMERDKQWLDAFVEIDTHIAFVGDPRHYVRAVWEPVKHRLTEESQLNVRLRRQLESVREMLLVVKRENDLRGFLAPSFAKEIDRQVGSA